MEKIYILTVINSITETSMPYNEFALYRNDHEDFPNQSVIVLSSRIPDKIRIPDNLDIHIIGKRITKFPRLLYDIHQKCKRENKVLLVHLHHPKSGFVFFLFTLFGIIPIKTVFTIHSLFCAYNIKNKFLSCICSLCSNKVVAVSRSSYLAYPGFIKKIKRDQFTYIQNGVDLDRIDTVSSPKRFSKNRDRQTITLICVGRLIAIKNQSFLLSIIKELKFCRLILIGNGDMEQSLKDYCKKEHIDDRVTFMGLIPRNKVFEVLKNADIYVSSSLVEGMPISVLEAMYIGIPAVLSNIPSHLEISQYTEAVCTLPLDKELWIKKIKEYYELNREERISIGKKCRFCAKEHFSLKKMHEKYNNLFQSFIAGKE